MLGALKPFYMNSRRGGVFINSCFAHCQSEPQDTWFRDDSPRINNKVWIILIDSDDNKPLYSVWNFKFVRRKFILHENN